MMRSKILFFISALLCLMFCLGGCSPSPSPDNLSAKDPAGNLVDVFAPPSSDPFAARTPDEIIEDVSDHPDFVNSCPVSGFTITGIDIVKRQTDAEHKTDKIFATFNVANESEGVRGYMDFIVDYGLYNEGWILDNCEVNYDGTNDGLKFFPTKGPEFSAIDLAQDLSATLDGAWDEVEVYDSTVDLDAGVAHYFVTGKSVHKYVTETVNATVSYTFFDTYGCWTAPMVEVNDLTEHWSLAGDYYLLNLWGETFKYITLISNEPVEGFEVQYSKGLDPNAFGLALYDTNTVTFKSLMLNALDWGLGTPWGSFYDKQDLEQNNFDAEMKGDYSSLSPFEYATFWLGGNPSSQNEMLLIGKDDLAIIEDDDSDTDRYHLRVSWTVNKLIPASEADGSNGG